MTTLTADVCPRCGAPVKPKTVDWLCAYCGALLRSARAVDPSAPGPKSESDERIVGLFELGIIAHEAGRVDDSFAVRHNDDDDEQLRRVLALVGDVARHPVRNQLHPVTVEALAALYNSAAEHLRARGRDA